jgi:hypothetical protein
MGRSYRSPQPEGCPRQCGAHEVPSSKVEIFQSSVRCLFHWLISLCRNLNIPDAREMLVSTLRWRHSFNIEAVLKEEFPQDVFGNVGYIQGHDKEGRPVVYVEKVVCAAYNAAGLTINRRYNFYGVSNIQEVFSDVQRFLR